MNEKLAIHTPDGMLNHVDISKTQIDVYVKEGNEDMKKLRNNYLVYTGGQKYIVCGDHKLSLIVFSKCDNKYTSHNLPYNTIQYTERKNT